jgi:hypothetical protein
VPIFCAIKYSEIETERGHEQHFVDHFSDAFLNLRKEYSYVKIEIGTSILLDVQVVPAIDQPGFSGAEPAASARVLTALR